MIINYIRFDFIRISHIVEEKLANLDRHADRI